MSKPLYKYIVVHKNKFTFDAITDALAQTCGISGNETIFRFKDVEKNGFFVDHGFITKLKNNNDSRLKYELYQQTGGGSIRKYSIPGKKDSAPVKKAKQDAKKAVDKKQGA